MKRLLYFIIGAILFTGVAAAQSLPSQSPLWVSGSYITTTPLNTSLGFQIPSLANNNCLGTDSSGHFETGTCSGGGGGSGVATTSLTASYPVKVTSNSATINFSLLNMATTTATCSGTVSCSQFVVIGSSPITITGSGGGGGSGNVSTSTHETAGGIAYWTSNSATPALLGEVATSTLTASSPLTGSFTQIGSSGSLGCQTASGSQAGCLSSTDWTTFNNKLGADPFWVYANSAVSTSTPVLITASTTIGNGNQNGGLTINGGATTTGNSILQSKLLDQQGTSQFIYNSWPALLWELSQGTAAAPVTASGSTFKISRTEAVASTTCNTNATDNECNSALVVEDNSAATAASSTQQTNAIWASAEGEPENTDVVGLTSIGRAIGLANGIGTGAYLQGRRDTQTALALGAEIRASNFTTASSVYNPFQISSTSALWITSQSSAAGITNGVGIAFGAIAGSSFNTGIGFTQGSIASTSISDDSTASTSIAIGGVHAVAAIAVAAGAGNSGFGTKTPTAEIDDNGALYVENGNGLRLYGTNSNFSTINYDTTNGKVDATWPFNFQDGITTGSSYAALIPPSGGALFANNVGISTTTAGTVLSLGGVANFTAATSTFYSTGGINLTNGGCFAVNGACISGGGGGSSASSTLLTDNNTFSGTNIFSNLLNLNSGFIASASSTIGSGGVNGLTINGNATTTGTAYFAGKVGIGTTTPSTALSIQNSVGSTTLAVSTTDTSANLFEIASSSGAAYLDITSNGLVGIGTTTPGSLLSLNNIANFTPITSTLWSALTIATTSSSALNITDQYNTSVLNVSTASSTNNNPIFQILGTSTPGTLFQVDQYGHLLASSTPATPTVSSCGSGSPALTAGSNDVTGDVTTGTAATSCTITFGAAYSVTPEVFITGGSAASVTAVTSRSTTAFTIGIGTAATGDDISYFVIMP